MSNISMLRIQYLCLTVALYWIKWVKGEEECEFYNIDFKEMVAGIDGIVESSDPIYIKILESDSPNFKYVLHNATVTGVKKCEAIHLQCDKKNKKPTFQFYVECPELVITADYEASGDLGFDLVFEGHGIETDVAEDYVIMFDGTYEIEIGEDEVARPVIVKYSMDTEPRGIVTFNIENDHHPDKDRDAQINKFLNENWREMEKVFKNPVITSFMDVFVTNLNTYSKSK